MSSISLLNSSTVTGIFFLEDIPAHRTHLIPFFLEFLVVSTRIELIYPSCKGGVLPLNYETHPLYRNSMAVLSFLLFRTSRLPPLVYTTHQSRWQALHHSLPTNYGHRQTSSEETHSRCVVDSTHLIAETTACTSPSLSLALSERRDGTLKPPTNPHPTPASMLSGDFKCEN